MLIQWLPDFKSDLLPYSLDACVCLWHLSWSNICHQSCAILWL